MKRLLILNTIRNDIILIAAGFLTVIIFSLSFSQEAKTGPEMSLLSNPEVQSYQIIPELGVTVVEFKNGLTCVVPFNKKSLSCTQRVDTSK